MKRRRETRDEHDGLERGRALEGSLTKRAAPAAVGACATTHAFLLSATHNSHVYVLYDRSTCGAATDSHSMCGHRAVGPELP